jgi:uncharacterized protein (TIGR00369 family)
MTDATIGVTYPPAHHILRALHYEVEHRPDLTSTARMDVAPHLVGADGAVEPGALATLVDATGGGLAATAAHPDWIATADLTLHLLAPVHADAVTATGRVVRRGRTTVVLAVDLTDDHGIALGTATMSFAVLPRRDGNPVMPPIDEPVHHAFLPLDDEPIPLLPDAIGITVDGVDAVAPMTPFVVNTLGAMQGGAVSTLIARAATEAATDAIGAVTTCVDLEVTFLTLGRVGPIRAVPRLLRSEADWCSVAIEVRDEGNDHRLMTVARAVAVVPSPIGTDT